MSIKVDLFLEVLPTGTGTVESLSVSPVGANRCRGIETLYLPEGISLLWPPGRGFSDAMGQSKLGNADLVALRYRESPFYGSWGDWTWANAQIEILILGVCPRLAKI